MMISGCPLGRPRLPISRQLCRFHGRSGLRPANYSSLSRRRAAMASSSSDAGQGAVDDNRERLDAFYASFKDKLQVKDMSPPELKALLDEGMQPVVVVDVRDAGEVAVSRLPGDKVLTKEQFEADIAAFKDHLVVPYCTVGYRSGKYAEKLQQDGFKVANLAGSILGWIHHGYPIVDGKDPSQMTKDVHVFNSKFAMQPSGYNGVTFSLSEIVGVGLKSVLPKSLGGTR